MFKTSTHANASLLSICTANLKAPRYTWVMSWSLFYYKARYSKLNVTFSYIYRQNLSDNGLWNTPCYVTVLYDVDLCSCQQLG